MWSILVLSLKVNGQTIKVSKTRPSMHYAYIILIDFGLGF